MPGSPVGGLGYSGKGLSLNQNFLCKSYWMGQKRGMNETSDSYKDLAYTSLGANIHGLGANKWKNYGNNK